MSEALNQLAAAMDRISAATTRLNEATADANKTASGEAANGSVVAVFASTGTLQELRIEPSHARAVHASRLAQDMLTALAEGQAELGRRRMALETLLTSMAQELGGTNGATQSG